MSINVIGLGHVGETVLRHLAAQGKEVAGLDRNPAIAQRLSREGYRVTTQEQALPAARIWLLATSTGPACSHLIAAFKTVLRLNPPSASLISIESTVPPGTTEFLAEIARDHGRVPGVDLYLAHVPHRVLLGQDATPFDQPRVVGGLTPACRRVAQGVYAALGAAVIPVSSVRTAELCKLVENTQRFVDVAFAEALAVHCWKQGLDFDELREAVNSKPNVKLMNVDYGVGGECLPKDIRLLQESMPSALLAAAVAVDESYQEALFARLAGATSVVLHGLTYKPGYRDLGFSRAVELARRLMAAGVEVAVSDELYTPEELAAQGFPTRLRHEASAWRVVRGRIHPPEGGPLHE